MESGPTNVKNIQQHIQRKTQFEIYQAELLAIEQKIHEEIHGKKRKLNKYGKEDPVVIKNRTKGSFYEDLL